MSEPIMKALVQLFALIIDIDGDKEISNESKDIVKSFLVNQLNSELAHKYMNMFEEHLLLYHSESIVKGSIREKKRTSLTAMRILSICEKINEELHQAQKVYVIIQVMDFLLINNKVTENEFDFLETLSSAFNIPHTDYQNIKNFILVSLNEIPEKDQVLLINNKEKSTLDRGKHLKRKNLEGVIAILNVIDISSYILRYDGNQDIYLNGQIVNPGKTYIFDRGSTIRSSGIKTIYYYDICSLFSSEKAEKNIRISAQGISYKFNNSANGIHNLDFSEESGTLVGILGGSGVGKTTLFNILCGLTEPQDGKILINGYDLYSKKDSVVLNGILGYVPQEDLLIEDLTVYQNLYYCAKLCLDDQDSKQIAKVLDSVLDELDLKEIKDLKVGSPLEKVISGGQRKRLNIALELIREPAVLFVDEPTSGLSSIDAENVMNLLKEQTDNGKLAIVNIHQPSSYLYKMFDKVLIIDKGGHQIFYGNPMEAVVYFKKMSKHANPNEDQCSLCGTVNTDLVLQIIDEKVVNEKGKLTSTRKVSPEEWSRLFKENIKIDYDISSKKLNIPESNFRIPRRLKQLYLFFERDVVSKLANRQYLLISLLGAPLLAFILGYLTKYIDGSSGGNGEYVFYLNENLPAYLFMCVIVSLFLGLLGSSEEIIKDRKIQKREMFLNLSHTSYLNSKVFVLFILAAIQILSFVVIGNAILEIKGMTLSYWLILFSTSCFAILLGLNISSGFNKAITAYILIPFLLVPQLLLSGVIVNFDKLHKSFTNFDDVPLIGDFMTSRWSYEALAVHQFKDNEFQKLTFKYDMSDSQNTWYCDFLIKELYKETQLCRKAIGVEENRDHFQENLIKLHKYIAFLSNVAGISNDNVVNNLNTSSFDTIIARQTSLYLEELRKHFRSQANASRLMSDSIKNDLDNFHGEGYVVNLKLKYHNENLGNFVLNHNETDQFLETETRIIQKSDLAYRIPLQRNGRAHFYAPIKRLGNISIDTYWFNMFAIWFLTGLLYLALRADLLRKILQGSLGLLSRRKT